MLTTATRCSHPVIFLKDVSAEHVRLLIQYMYVGQIAVRKEVNKNNTNQTLYMYITIFRKVSCDFEKNVVLI